VLSLHEMFGAAGQVRRIPHSTEKEMGDRQLGVLLFWPRQERLLVRSAARNPRIAQSERHGLQVTSAVLAAGHALNPERLWEPTGWTTAAWKSRRPISAGGRRLYRLDAAEKPPRFFRKTLTKATLAVRNILVR